MRSSDQVSLRTPTNIAWLAGLFEGEGSCWIKRGRPTLAICMTDEDVIRRAREVAGVGHIDKPRTLPSGKTAWTWRVSRIEHAVGLAMTLYSLLGQRRQAKIREALDAWKATPLPRRLRTHCKYGHPLSGANLYREGNHRRCKVCRAAIVKRSNLRRNGVA